MLNIMLMGLRNDCFSRVYLLNSRLAVVGLLDIVTFQLDYINRLIYFPNNFFHYASTMLDAFAYLLCL